MEMVKYKSPSRIHKILPKEEVAAGKKSHWLDLQITGKIRNLDPELFKLNNHLTSLFLNDNNLSRIPVDITRLVSLTYLDLSNNKLRSLPAELGEMVLLRELLLNNNYLKTVPYEFGKLFQLQNLGLKGNPLNPEISSVYNEENGIQKLLSFMLDNLTISASEPPQRPWIPLSHPERTRSTIFTVMCYNVLCAKYATRQLYGYCPSWALNWNYRREIILDEIRYYGPDIISLQEVETDQFFNYFLPELKSDGYDGIFSPKSRAKTMVESKRKFVDGCAIFYRTSKFTLVQEHLIEFNQLAMVNAEGSDDMLKRVMTKDNIGLAALLQTKQGIYENGVMPEGGTKQAILVCTAHIHWDPENCDVKLIQTMMLMNELKQIVDETLHTFWPGSCNLDPNTIPLIMCGDLNSLPESGVIEFLTSGRISSKHGDFKELGYKASLSRMNSTDKLDEFTHSFKIANTYENNVIPYTTYTFHFKGIIDYIFYSKQHIVPIGLLGPLDPEYFRQNRIVGCPYPHIPSDHFPLLVELELQSSPSPFSVNIE